MSLELEEGQGAIILAQMQFPLGGWPQPVARGPTAVDDAGVARRPHRASLAARADAIRSRILERACHRELRHPAVRALGKRDLNGRAALEVVS